MSFKQRAVAEWLGLTLLFALLLGGKPWKFPGEGRYWLEYHLLQAKRAQSR